MDLALVSRSSRRILVTGARGYIGGRVVQDFVARGCDVVGTSRGSIRPPDRWPGQADFQVMDPLDLPNNGNALSGVDTVIHLAAANELRSQQDPDAALVETGSGTRRLLAACIESGVKRFVFLSTIHVYGAPLAGVLSEQQAVHPIHPYAITHLAGESFTLAAAATGAIEGLVVRLSNAIGAPAWTTVDRWSLVGNDLARQAVETGTINVKAPDHWRDFIAMSDVCDALFRLATSEKAGQGIYNLASGSTIQVRLIAERVAAIAADLAGRSVTVNMAAPLNVAEQSPFLVDIERMRALGFKPSPMAALDDEIRKTLLLLSPSIADKVGSETPKADDR